MFLRESFYRKGENMGQLEGKTAIVTGGGTGIGRAIVKRFHDEGAVVVICGRRMNMLNETAESIDPESPRILCVKTDVTDEKDIMHLYKSTMSKSSRIDILVNNAGVMRFGSLTETPLDDWNLMMKTNTWGPWRLMVNVLPFMKQGGGGSIINISSIAGIKSYPGAGIYCASKAAVQVISQVFAMETCR